MLPRDPHVGDPAGARRPDQIRQQLLIRDVDPGGESRVVGVDVHHVGPAARLQRAEVVAAECPGPTAGRQQQRVGGRHRGGVLCGHPGEHRGELDLLPQVEVVVAGGTVGAEPDGHRLRPQPRQAGDAGGQFRVRPGTVRDPRAPRGEQCDVRIGQMYAVRGDDPAVEHSHRVQQRGHRPVCGALVGVLVGGLGHVDLHEGAPVRRRLRDLVQGLGGQHVRRVRRIGQLDPLTGPEAQAVGVDPAVRVGQHRAPVEPGQVDDRPSDDRPCPRGEHGVGHLPGVEVHLRAGGHPAAQHLDRAEQHPGAHVRTAQLRLGGPDHLPQPAQQRQVPAHAAHQHHGAVRVRVDQAGQQDAGQLSHRARRGGGRLGRAAVGDATGVVDVDDTVPHDGAGGIGGEHDGSPEPVGHTGRS